MSRSKWKGPFLDPFILYLKNKNFKTILIKSRSSVIPSWLIGYKVKVYNGKTFKKLDITRKKVGYKFGEFSTTKIYNKKKKLKKRR